MKTIRTLTRDHPSFYLLMGPWLASRAVQRELGMPPWDDPGKVWYLFLEDDVLRGFAGTVESARGLRLCSIYVLPEARGRGVFRALLDAILSANEGKRITATVTDASLHECLKRGFVAVGKRGKYTNVELPARGLRGGTAP